MESGILYARVVPRNLICSKASQVFLIHTAWLKNHWLWWQGEAACFIKSSEEEHSSNLICLNLGNNAGCHFLWNGYRRMWVTQKSSGSGKRLKVLVPSRTFLLPNRCLTIIDFTCEIQDTNCVFISRGRPCWHGQNLQFPWENLMSQAQSAHPVGQWWPLVSL